MVLYALTFINICRYLQISAQISADICADIWSHQQISGHAVKIYEFRFPFLFCEKMKTIAVRGLEEHV